MLITQLGIHTLCCYISKWLHTCMFAGMRVCKAWSRVSSNPFTATVIVSHPYMTHLALCQLNRLYHLAVGSGPRYMICVILFCMLSKSETTRTCENCTRNTCNYRMSVCFLTRATCKNVRQNLIPRATAYLAMHLYGVKDFTDWWAKKNCHLVYP